MRARVMKLRFEDLAIGGVFYSGGKRYVKLARSMAEDEDRVGTIFQAEREVEAEPVGGAGGAVEG